MEQSHVQNSGQSVLDGGRNTREGEQRDRRQNVQEGEWNVRNRRRNVREGGQNVHDRGRRTEHLWEMTECLRRTTVR